MQPAILAPVAVMFVDRTVHVAATLVAQILANRTLEKPLAAFARNHAVVPTGCFVLSTGKEGVTEMNRDERERESEQERERARESERECVSKREMPRDMPRVMPRAVLRKRPRERRKFPEKMTTRMMDAS